MGREYKNASTSHNMALSLSMEHNNPEKAIVIHTSRTNRQQLHDSISYDDSDLTKKQVVSLGDEQEQELKLEFFRFPQNAKFEPIGSLGSSAQA